MSSSRTSPLKADRVAIVTGGTRGIGLAIAKSLCRSGAKVALVYRSNREVAEAARREVENIGYEAVAIQSDVATKQGAVDMAGQVLELWGSIDILVNNAGVFEFSAIESMTEEFFDWVYATNLKSVLFCTQAVLAPMKTKRYGRIINASSISGRLADVGLVAYGCSKAGVDMFTRIAAAELAPYGITVNAYSPGIIETEMTRSMIESRGADQVKQIPARRFGRPEDVAALVTFLCSEQASYITGEVIGVDGGMLKVQNPSLAYHEIPVSETF